MKAQDIEYPRSFVAIDFETISGKRLYVCQVGMVKYINGLLVDTYAHLICPPPGAPRVYHHVHNITLEDVKDEPSFADLLPEMEQFVGNLPLVAHNGQSIERACFRENLKHYGVSTTIDCEHIIDTQSMAKVVMSDMSHKLPDLCEYYSICVDNHHDAAADARMCGELYLRLIDEPNVPPLHLIISIRKKSNSGKSGKSKYNENDMQEIDDLSEFRDNPFLGKYVCLTGFDYEESTAYGARLHKMGATMRNSVSGKVNILVVGTKNPGPKKISQAEERGICMMRDFEMRLAIREYFQDDEDGDDDEDDGENERKEHRKEKWKKWGKRFEIFGIPILAALFWPYILGILIGLFAALVFFGMAIRGFKALR